MITSSLPVRLLNEHELAKILGITVHTIRSWRLSGSPIPFRRIGRSIRYAPSDITAYIEAAKANSTTEAVYAPSR